MHEIILVWCLVAISSATAADEELENVSYLNSRIIGGVPVDIRTVPYQVAIEILVTFYCGGALISVKHVVTAAHCLKYPYRDMRIRMGSTKSLKGGEIYEVLTYKKHKKYREKPIPDYDVGIITLKKKAKLSERVQVINLMRSEIEPDQIVHVTGWGRFKVKGRKMSPVLLFLYMKTISRSTCKNMIRHHSELITNRMICAFAEEKSPSHGDSGGPLVYKNELVGLVSWGFNCQNDELPEIFTNIGNPEILSFLLNVLY